MNPELQPESPVELEAIVQQNQETNEKLGSIDANTEANAYASQQTTESVKDVESAVEARIVQAEKHKEELMPSMEAIGKAMTFASALLEKLEGPQGPQGEQGIQGEKGEKGDKGEDSTIAGPQGIQGERGQDGKDGINGKDGVNGKDGKDGAQGKEGKKGKDGKDADTKKLTEQLDEKLEKRVSDVQRHVSSRTYAMRELEDTQSAIAGQTMVKQADGSWSPEDQTGGGGSGDVVGPASATDNAIARFDATTGKIIQNSLATIADNGRLDVNQNWAGTKSVIAAFNNTNPGAPSTAAEIQFPLYNGWTNAPSASLELADNNYGADWIFKGKVSGSSAGVYRQLLRVNNDGTASFLGDVSVPDEAFSTAWNGSLETPTKNAIYDAQTSVDVRTYGAKPDAKTVTDIVLTSGNTTATSATAGFVAGDTGKSMIVYDVTNNTYPFRGTITYVNSTTVTLSSNALASVSTGNGIAAWGTNYATEIQAALTAADALVPSTFSNASFPTGRGRVTVVFPTDTTGDAYLFNSTLTATAGVTIDADATLISNVGTGAANRTWAMDLAAGVQIKNLVMYCMGGMGITLGDNGNNSSSYLQNVQLWHVGTDSTASSQIGLQFTGYDLHIGRYWIKGGNVGLDINQGSDVFWNQIELIGCSTGIRLANSENIRGKVTLDTNSFAGMIIDGCRNVQIQANAFAINATASTYVVLQGEYDTTNINRNIVLDITAHRTGGTVYKVSNSEDCVATINATNAAIYSAGGTNISTAVIYGTTNANTGAMNIRVNRDAAITAKTGTVVGTFEESCDGAVIETTISRSLIGILSLTNASVSSALAISQTGVLGNDKGAIEITSNTVHTGINAALIRLQNQNTSNSKPSILMFDSSTGAAVDLNKEVNGVNMVLDKDVTNANHTTNNLQIDHTSVVTDAATYTKTGAALQINSNVTETSGTITDTAQVLDINQTHADASGDVVNITTNGTGQGLVVQSTGSRNNSAHAVFINDDGTSALNAALRIDDENTSGTWATLSMQSERAGAAIDLDMNGNGTSINIDHDGNSASVITGISVDVVNAGAGGVALIDLKDNTTSKFKVDGFGKTTQFATNTTVGTTGNQTINRPTGTVNIAAAGTTVTVTNSTCSTSSIVLAVIRTNDTTAVIKNVVPGAGSFVINLNAAATAEVSIGFIVLN